MTNVEHVVSIWVFFFGQPVARIGSAANGTIVLPQ